MLPLQHLVQERLTTATCLLLANGGTLRQLDLPLLDLVDFLFYVLARAGVRSLGVILLQMVLDGLIHGRLNRCRCFLAFSNDLGVVAACIVDFLDVAGHLG